MAGKPATSSEINDFRKMGNVGRRCKGELRETYAKSGKSIAMIAIRFSFETKTEIPITDATVKLKNKDGKVVWETQIQQQRSRKTWGRFEMSSTEIQIWCH